VADLTLGIEWPVIGEIGGGYGGLAYFLLRDIPEAKYVNFDLPETLVLMAYYLSCSLPEKRLYLYEGGAVNWPELLDNFDIILFPHWAIDLLPENSVDVFVNSFSLSEMRPETVNYYVNKVTDTCRNFFLHNNMDRAGVVNEGFERVPASTYPIDYSKFRRIYVRYDMYQTRHSGRDGDYREFLFQKRHEEKTS
jgi:hypothetical protein